jgi:predicted O-methyltransferase YrrM
MKVAKLMKLNQKVGLAARLLARNPGELWERGVTFLQGGWDAARPKPASQRPITFEELLEQLRHRISAPNLSDYTAEIAQIESDMQPGLKQIAEHGPFRASHNADFLLARTCYLSCRVMKPKVVVETGVAYGVTSAFILHALASNDCGRLWSVDLPPLAKGADDYVGCLVPQQLRDRWRLTRGSAQRVLPNVLAAAENIDIFIHDSLHTYAHMTFEFSKAWPNVRAGGILIADDVDGNRAFEDFALRVSPSYSAVVRERDKPGSFGLMLKRLESEISHLTTSLRYAPHRVSGATNRGDAATG